MITNNTISEWGVPQYGELECITSYDNDSRRYLTYNFGGPGTFEGGPDAAIGAFNQDIIYLGVAAQISDLGLDQTSDIIRTSDGGAIVVGSTAGPGLGVSTVFITKIGPGEVYPTTAGAIVNDLVDVKNIVTNNLLLFPNPFSSHINIIGEHHPTKINVIALTGENLLNKDIIGAEEIDLSFLKAGTYLIILETPQGRFQQRLVKR